MSSPLRLATRGSALAQWQAGHVADLLRAVDPGIGVELVVVETTGDVRTDVPLHAIGGQGVFVKEVQQAVLDGRADVTVHSAKDLPSGPAPDGLVLAAVPPRGDARDALVGSRLADLAPGAHVATGAVRRRAQLAALRPDLVFDDLRGNVDTRLGKVPDGGAIVVAQAALERLGRTDRAAEVLTVEHMVPQVGQGALAVECRRDDDRVRDRLAKIESALDRRLVELERAFLATLGGGCDVPVGAHACLDDDGQLVLYSFLAGPTGLWRDRRHGPVADHGWVEAIARNAATTVGLGVMDAATGETVELLQTMIRNACVNDGTAESGHEARSADVLQTYLEGAGLDVEGFEPTPGRRSVVARIEGSDPTAPTLLLMGHTDVVPVSPSGWRRDPFGGELVDGEIWGRGAIDMLNLTASMAVATKHLARQGWRPRGTLVYLGVADEEAGGRHGADWLVQHELDAVGADYVITESGGWSVHGRSGAKVVVTVGEKGAAWRRVTVHGTPAHGSMPFGADNALVKAAEVVRRIAAYRPAAEINDVWRAYADSFDLDAETRAALVDPARAWEACAAITDPRTAKFAHACTHTTFSPDVVHGGTKTNVIPDEVALEIDIRILPGQTAADVDGMLADALGPLSADVTVERLHDRPSTQSPTDTPLWHAIEALVAKVRPEATLLPRITPGGTDATFFRDAGSVAYGFGLLSPAITFEDFSSRFHGNDERIDVESLRLTTQCWLELCPTFLG